MPDITLVVRGLSETVEAERLERALVRLGFINVANVDPAKELMAVSYEGGEAELDRIWQAVRDVGYEPELTPGSGKVAGR